MNVYHMNGFKDRDDYLEYLTREYDSKSVYWLAEALGPNEDFDGLVIALEDCEGI